MALAPRPAAALLLGLGATGAATMLMMLAGDLASRAEPGADAAPAVLLGSLFGLLVTLPLPLALHGLLRRGAPTPQPTKALATLGTMLWLAGLGVPLYTLRLDPGVLTAAHGLGLAGAAALALAGWQAYRAPATLPRP